MPAAGSRFVRAAEDGGRMMADPARSLYEALRALEHRAVAARRKAGLPSSRRAAADAARKAPYDVAVDSRRISSWLPEDPASSAGTARW